MLIAFLGASTGFAAERAVDTRLGQQGKPDLPLDRVVDAPVIEEVLRERR